jgi:hypothetical protein
MICLSSPTGELRSTCGHFKIAVHAKAASQPPGINKFKENRTREAIDELRVHLSAVSVVYAVAARNQFESKQLLPQFLESKWVQPA